jgi:hypothetical protein
MEGYFGTNVYLIAFMAVIAFIFWIKYKRINLNVKTNEFRLRANVPVDGVGTNGKAASNILKTLSVNQRLIGSRRSLRELQ